MIIVKKKIEETFNFMDKKRSNSKEKYEHEQCFKFTDYTLLICDKDETSWWVFNCLTEKLNKYDMCS